MRAGTNLGVAAATLLLLLGSLPSRDLIPAGRGLGYDGQRYAGWVRNPSLEDFLASDSRHLDAYSARRLLPSVIVHYGLRLVEAPASRVNIIRGFTAANIALLVLTAWWWCRAADELAVGAEGKWLGFLALVVSYANWRMPLYYPVLTDSFALAFGAAMLLLWLRRKSLALVAVSFAGGFVWPTVPYFGVLMVAFPRGEGADGGPAPRAAHLWAAGAAALSCLTFTGWFLAAGHTIRATQVRPIEALVVPSALLSALVLFLALRPLLDSAALWRSLHPVRVLRAPHSWAALGLLVAVEAAVRTLASHPAKVTAGDFLADTFISSIVQPGIAYLAHVLYFGPLLLFLPFVWGVFVRRIQREGTGMVLCLALALAIGVGSESRKLVNFLPAVVLFLVPALEGRARTPGPWALLVLATVACSKIWLPMSRVISLPGLGTVGWRTLYVSSRGPWIDHAAYAGQLAVMLVLAGLIYAFFLRDRGPVAGEGRR